MERTGWMLSFVWPEARGRVDQPLRAIRRLIAEKDSISFRKHQGLSRQFTRTSLAAHGLVRTPRPGLVTLRA